MIRQRPGVIGACVALLLTVTGCNGCDGIVNPDEPIKITEWEAAPAWSNAGDRITFASPGVVDTNRILGLYVVDTSGENLRLLSAGGGGSVWLPGDTAIVFHKIDFRLYYLDLRTMEESLLVGGFTFSPDRGKTDKDICFEGRGVSDGWATSVYGMDLLTGDTTHIVGGSFPKLSPDGRYLLIRRNGVIRYDLQTKEQVQFYGLGRQFDWSPDGQTILIDDFERREFRRQVHKIDGGGGNSRYFTSGKHSRYSPSGERIALIRASSDGRDHVWLIDADGGNAKQLTF